MLAAPLVFRALHVLSCGPGCSVCPWAAARPLAVRAASFARRIGSKPGQDLPPPTGTAAMPSCVLRALRRPPHRRRLVADARLGASARCPARTRLSASMSHVIPLRVFQNVEFTSLELQRFETFFKTDRVKLRATYGWLGPCRCLRALKISRVKPSSPLLARARVGLKLLSPVEGSGFFGPFVVRGLF